ncbi:MAG: dihydrolipoyl dehydrogenase family protein [Candidatus Muiribacteriota bacterium]
MSYDYDILVIGLGPAGMAVSAMGSEMGLKVCGVEKRRIGGECMNVGCIPSKAILRYSKNVHNAEKLLNKNIKIKENLFENINEDLDFIHDKKMAKMLNKVDIIYDKAQFINKHTVKAGKKEITAAKIFIATGTTPLIPPIPGIEKVNYHTNETIFNLKKVPSSMVVIGGGAIGVEMAQAFSRLSSKVSIVHNDPNLIHGPSKNEQTILDDIFKDEGIILKNGEKITHIKQDKNETLVKLESGETLKGEVLLVATGRLFNFEGLNLENAGVKYNKKGIIVNKHLRTTTRNIYAAGDCNGNVLLSHAAMHQGMLALINSMSPFFMRKKFKNYVVPWTVFTEPQISRVGLNKYMLKKKKVKFETIKAEYGNYGAAIAEKIPHGSVEVYCSPFGRIYGAKIVGEGSGEMINEFAMAIQYNIKLYNILFLQHSFPTMSFLIKRISEIWMMKKMKSNLLKKICRFAFKLF